MNLIATLDKGVGRVCRFGVISGLIIVFGLLFVSIIARAVGFQIAGYDEVVELSIIWITMLGTIELWRTDTLYRVEFLEVLSQGKPSLRAAAVQLMMLIFLAVLVVKGAQFAWFTREATPFLRLPKLYFYSAIPVSAAVMSLYSLARLVKNLHGLVVRPKPEAGRHYAGTPVRLSTKQG